MGIMLLALFSLAWWVLNLYQAYNLDNIIQTHRNFDCDGKEYWTAWFNLDGLVGGGDTEEEAVSALKENLMVYIEWLNKEGKR
jgi:predicted RNase H-like HicB family nuclease